MPDIFLYSGEPNPGDVRLADPTQTRGGISGITGTGSLSLTSATLSSAGLLRFIGSGTPSITAATLSGTSTLRFTATGQLSISTATVSATGRLAFKSTGSLLISSVTLDGAASAANPITGTGSLTITSAVVSGTGNNHSIVETPVGGHATGVVYQPPRRPPPVFARGAIYLEGPALSAKAKYRYTVRGAASLSIPPPTLIGLASEDFSRVEESIAVGLLLTNSKD